MVPCVFSAPKRSNCLLWAWQQQRRYGGYLLLRRSHYARWSPHVLWVPPCGRVFSYCPLAPVRRWFPPLFFRGTVVEGDPCDAG